MTIVGFGREEERAQLQGERQSANIVVGGPSPEGIIPVEPKDYNPYIVDGINNVMIYNDETVSLESVLVCLCELGYSTEEALYIAMYVTNNGSAVVSRHEKETDADDIVDMFLRIGVTANSFYL